MTGIARWARLSFRLQRLEILLLGAAVLVASALMLWSAFQLGDLYAAYPECDFFDQTRACQAAGQRFSEVYGSAELIINNTWVVGFPLGLLLGVPLVAREVEHRTAQLAWTIGRSRVRWLVHRVAFAALVAIALLSLLAVVTEALASAMRGGQDTSQIFWLHGNRGPLIVGRGMLGFGVGVLVGALLGRQLPALLAGVIVVGALYWASWAAFPIWYENEAVVASIDEWVGEPLWVDSGIELTSGERVSWGEWLSMSGELGPWTGIDGAVYANQADAENGRNPIGREYILIIPGERYNEIVARETAVFSGVGAVFVAGAAAVTVRRRPT